MQTFMFLMAFYNSFLKVFAMGLLNQIKLPIFFVLHDIMTQLEEILKTKCQNSLIDESKK